MRHFNWQECEKIYLGTWRGSYTVQGTRVWRVIDVTLDGSLVVRFGRDRNPRVVTQERFEEIITAGRASRR